MPARPQVKLSLGPAELPVRSKYQGWPVKASTTKPLSRDEGSHRPQRRLVASSAVGTLRLGERRQLKWRCELLAAAGEGERVLTRDSTIAEVLTDFVPLSEALADQITGLRSWAEGRARFATSPQTERTLRKLAA